MAIREIEWLNLSDRNKTRWLGGIGNWKPLYIEKGAYRDEYILYCYIYMANPRELARAHSMESAKEIGEAYLEIVITESRGQLLHWEQDHALQHRYFGYIDEMPFYTVRHNAESGLWSAIQNPVGFNEFCKLDVGSRKKAEDMCQEHFNKWIKTLFV